MQFNLARPGTLGDPLASASAWFRLQTGSTTHSLIPVLTWSSQSPPVLLLYSCKCLLPRPTSTLVPRLLSYLLIDSASPCSVVDRSGSGCGCLD